MRAILGKLLPLLLISCPAFAQNAAPADTSASKAVKGEWYVPSKEETVNQGAVNAYYPQLPDAAFGIKRDNSSPKPATSNPELSTPQSVSGNDLQVAVNCAASLQIAALAAPEWSSERGVAIATNYWLGQVFNQADKAGIPGDKVKDMIKAEMDKQTAAAANNAASLNKNAFDCVGNMPY